MVIIWREGGFHSFSVLQNKFVDEWRQRYFRHLCYKIKSDYIDNKWTELHDIPSWLLIKNLLKIEIIHSPINLFLFPSREKNPICFMLFIVNIWEFNRQFITHIETHIIPSVIRRIQNHIMPIFRDIIVNLFNIVKRIYRLY